MSTLSGNTIDFDSARLKLAQGGASVPREPSSGRAASLQDVQQELGRTLQTSLELDRVLEMFLGGVRKLLAVDSLHYRNESSGFNLTLGAARCIAAVTGSRIAAIISESCNSVAADASLKVN